MSKFVKIPQEKVIYINYSQQRELQVSNQTPKKKLMSLVVHGYHIYRKKQAIHAGIIILTETSEFSMYNMYNCIIIPEEYYGTP